MLIACLICIVHAGAGKLGREEIKVGIAAVFDGHNGVEASETASRLLFEYFVLHIYFLLDSMFLNTLAKSKETLDNKGVQDVFQVLNWDENFNHHTLDPERCLLNSFRPELR